MVNNMPKLPKFHETFIPILTVLEKEQKVLPRKEIISKVKKQSYSDLPSKLLSQKTPKLGVNTLSNRIAWALSRLNTAKYVERPSRAHYQITAKAKKVLIKGSLTLKELERQLGQEPSNENNKSQDEDSPFDSIEKGLKAMEEDTKKQLLDELKKNTTPQEFERVVLYLLRAMGYGEPTETLQTHDDGIDGIIKEDELGLDEIYIQAKRLNEGKVRARDIREFIGAMVKTNKGIFITTSEFDVNARKQAREADQKKVSLINGDELVALMYEYDIGVQKKREVVIKEIDANFFDEEL